MNISDNDPLHMSFEIGGIGPDQSEQLQNTTETLFDTDGLILTDMAVHQAGTVDLSALPVASSNEMIKASGTELKHPKPSFLQRTIARFSSQMRERNATRAKIAGIRSSSELGKGKFKQAFKAGDDLAISTISAKDKGYQKEVKNYKMVAKAGLGGVVQTKGILEAKRADGQKVAFLCTEYCSGGTFESFLERSSLSDIHQVNIQLAENFDQLHNAGIVHHDIKPDNALIDKDGKPKVNDFGLMSKTTSKFDGSAVALKITPPELFGSDKTKAWQSPKYDVFQFGIQLFMSYTGRNKIVGISSETLPWGSSAVPNDAFPGVCIANPDYIKGQIAKDNKFQRLPDNLKELILSCVDGNPDRRPNMKQIANDLRGVDLSTLTPLIPETIPLPESNESQGGEVINEYIDTFDTEGDKPIENVNLRDENVDVAQSEVAVGDEYVSGENL